VGRPPAAPLLPPARQLAWLLVQAAEQETAEERPLVVRLQPQAELAHVQALVQHGRAMIRQRQADTLAPWLTACGISPVVELRNCADVLQRDAAPCAPP
jgi:hypothetical protein